MKNLIPLTDLILNDSLSEVLTHFEEIYVHIKAYIYLNSLNFIAT